MPRPHRKEYENAWYHVMNRGSGKMNCFNNKEQKELFISLLINACQKFNSEIHAYCLMDNHYHLLIRTPGAKLAQTMHDALSKYVKIFNLHEKRDGPLFRDRYKALPISGSSHLLQVSRYIHLNPVEAKITNRPENYPWSSYASYLSPILKPVWLKTDEVLSIPYLGCEELMNKNILNYKDYVENMEH